MNNIKAAKHLIKIAKLLISSELDQNLFYMKTAKNACHYIEQITNKYTHDVYNNQDKTYKYLNQSKQLVNNLGMTLIKSEQHVIQDDKLGSWKDTYHYEFNNNEGSRFTIAVQFNVMLAGTVQDHELSYDFTVASWDENTQTNILPPVSKDENMNNMKTKKQVIKYIYNLVDKYTHNVWNNENKDYKELREAYDIIDKLGMEVVDIENSKLRTGYEDKVNYQFMNNEGKIIDLIIITTVSYAGTVEDIKSRYDFTIGIY